VDDWRHYLLGAGIHSFTDISAQRYLQNTARPSARQVRWLEKLQPYSPLKIAHNPGKTNTTAGALSRNPSLKEEVIENGKPPPLDLAFLGAVGISTSLSVYIQPSVIHPSMMSLLSATTCRLLAIVKSIAQSVSLDGGTRH